MIPRTPFILPPYPGYYLPYGMPLEPKKPLRIGLLGGTFNPVHHWHLLTAECAIEQLKLDEIHFIPNGDPPHKQGVVDAEIRCELLQAAISPNKRFKLSRCEVDRVGKSYTSDTLQYYKKTYGQDVELFYIIGSDNLQYMTTWHNHEEIFKMAEILVAPRDHEVVDLEMIRAILPEGATYDILDCPGSAISSSLIRERVARGLTYRYAVTDSVWLGIRYYGLYRDPSIRTENGAESGLIGPPALASHENWALRYFNRDPVTLQPYRHPTLMRLLHRVGYHGSSIFQEPLNEK